MLLITKALEFGQVTFIIRVAINILAYGGVALIGLLLLSVAPRVANANTHNVINQSVTSSTTSSATVKWISKSIKGPRTEHSPPKRLILILFLSLIYSVLVTISDIGFLGFYGCLVPGDNLEDFPASLNSDSAAAGVVETNLVNGTDPATVRAYRCDSSKIIEVDGGTENQCISWGNSTYADKAFFSGLNSTDTDILMPRLLAHQDAPEFPGLDLNRYFVGPNPERVPAPMIQNGLAINPHETGLSVVVGVPHLKSNQKVHLNRTLAIELDVGCMKLGIFAQHELTAVGPGFDVFRINGTWREYAGPGYMQDVLTKSTDNIRSFFLPFFNASSVDSQGNILRPNTSLTLAPAGNIRDWAIANSTVNDNFLSNCTSALAQQLGIPPLGEGYQGTMCGFLGIGGSFAVNQVLNSGFTRMVCASAAQVNMVSATVEVDANDNISINVTRIPSDLNHLRADIWAATTDSKGRVTEVVEADPYERYTLRDNPNGSTTHFIAHELLPLLPATLGVGSAGLVISTLGGSVFNAFSKDVSFSGLGLLDNGFNELNFTAAAVVQWVGQVGASHVFASMGYNGWAARSSVPIEVFSTGGRIGTCYKPRFALGFLPLVLAALFLAGWTAFMIYKSTFFGSKELEKAYTGLAPYIAVVSPDGPPPPGLMMSWEADPRPHLQVVSQKMPVEGDPDISALEHLKSKSATRDPAP